VFALGRASQARTARASRSRRATGLLCRGGPPLPRRLVTLSKQAVYAAAVALCHLRTVLKNACVARHESVPAAALLAATRALAAEARRLAGAPLVHDLAAAAPALLAAAMSGAPAAPQPPAAPGTSAAQPAARPAFQAGSGAAACTAGAAAAADARPGRGDRGREGGGRGRQHGPSPEQAAAESRRLLARPHRPPKSCATCLPRYGMSCPAWPRRRPPYPHAGPGARCWQADAGGCGAGAQARQRDWQQDRRTAAMRAARGKLPAAAHAAAVEDAVAQNRVLVLSGATGCGKSTQARAARRPGPSAANP